MTRIGRKAWYVLAAAAIPALFLASPASATHSWGGYHWGRTANPFTLKLGDNVGTAWDSYLAGASTDWFESLVLDTVIVPGTVNPRTCKPRSGMVQVCNAKYGFNGWLGIAQIWLSGEHITQGVNKLNDSYFGLSTYNTPAWRAMVACQIAHTFGLDHQDENQTNTNLGTCMDYTNNPVGLPSNIAPNQHDYDELVTIYNHADSTTTVGNSASGAMANNANDWGQGGALHQGRQGLRLRQDRAGCQMVTFVTGAEVSCKTGRDGAAVTLPPSHLRRLC
jgi:hypothetical protein